VITLYSNKSDGSVFKDVCEVSSDSGKLFYHQNLDTTQNINKFSKIEQKVEDLEENFYKSFNLLEQKCDALKDQVTRITRTIEEEKVTRESYVIKKNEEIKNIDNKMMGCFYDQHEKIRLIEENIYTKLENLFNKIENETKTDNEQNKKNLELLKEYFDLEFSKCIEKTDLESDNREKIISNLIQQMNNEFENVHNNVNKLLIQVANETQQREENEEKILNTLKDVMKNIKNELDFEKKKK